MTPGGAIGKEGSRLGGRLRAALMATALSFCAAAPAAAQNDLDREAQALFEAGRVAFDAGRYVDALHHFEAAYDRSRRPGLLYNVGLAADRAGEVDLALRAYGKYLDSVPDSPHRATVQERIAALEQLEPDEEPEPPPNPMPVVQSAQPYQSPQPAPAPTTTPAAPPAPTATAPALTTVPQRPNTTTEPVETPSRAGPVLTLVAGAGLAVGGVALIASAFSAKSDAESTIEWPTANDANEQARRRSGAGYAMIGVGVVAAIAGIVWLRVSQANAYAVSLGPTRLRFEARF
jgi:tetratricopeptide (TPR) repeat protein